VRVAEGLRRRGVEAVSVYDERKTGLTDHAQLTHEGSVILLDGGNTATRVIVGGLGPAEAISLE
jgi:hypothetical protein